MLFLFTFQCPLKSFFLSISSVTNYHYKIGLHGLIIRLLFSLFPQCTVGIFLSLYSLLKHLLMVFHLQSKILSIWYFKSSIIISNPFFPPTWLPTTPFRHRQLQPPRSPSFFLFFFFISKHSHSLPAPTSTYPGCTHSLNNYCICVRRQCTHFPKNLLFVP